MSDEANPCSQAKDQPAPPDRVEVVPSGAGPSSSGDPSTDLVPPFRALLSNPAADSGISLWLPGPRGVQENFWEAGAEFPEVPGYQLVAELGQGGMGVVYLAQQLTLKRPVALKMILAGPHAGLAVRERFQTEAEAVARLQHPSIVQIHQVGEHSGCPFLALEYVPGGNLAQKIAGKAQPEREAAQLVETLARAIHYTHQRGILHRDLKPTNVLLTAEGTPKITDFGLAKLVDQDSGPTRSNTTLGTPNYMAPEQAAGHSRSIGAGADVYSLGAILYEMLTGQPPFHAETVLATLEQVRTQEPMPPRRLCGQVSRDLETICLKCLEKEPAHRYPSALALAEDLRRFLEGEAIQARPAAIWQKLWRSVRRRPVLVARLMGAAALLCLLLTCGWYFRVVDKVLRHENAQRDQQFVQHFNEALLHGLLAPDQGAIFLGSAPAATARKAETAAREALALAGVKPDAPTPAVDASFQGERRSQTTASCYTLLLLLASLRGQHFSPAAGGGVNQASQEALQLLDCARKLGLQSRAYHLRRACFLAQTGRMEEAHEDIDRASTIPPAGALDHFLIGEDQYRRGDLVEARNSFNRALTLQADHFWARFFLAVCHLRDRQWEMAKVGLSACLAQQPRFAWAYLYRSFANEKLQALAEAEADFQQALQLNPDEEARYILFLTRGILRFHQGQLNQAAADFSRGCALKPDQYNAYLNLAHVYLAQGRFDDAAEQEKKALQLQPPVEVVWGYHVDHGRSLIREKKYAEAIQACDTALELAPDRPLPCELRARALLALGRHEEAERWFSLYLERGGKAEPDVFRGRGLARMRLGRYPEAAEDYSRALERAPDGEIYQHLGWAHFFTDAWKLALHDFTRALELDPEAGDAYTGRGLARVMLGDYRRAVADVEEALRRKPASPEMMHNVACIFAQAGARVEEDTEREDRAALAADYRNRGLEAIRQTLQLLRPEQRRAFWLDKILPDRALAPLRQEEGFRRLEEEYARPPT